MFSQDEITVYMNNTLKYINVEFHNKLYFRYVYKIN